MKIITSTKGRVETEFYVIELDEPTKIDFVQQANDVIISSPEVDILIGWDYAKDEDFTETNSMLLKSFDNMKEISQERCTHFYMMPYKKGDKGRVYLTIQR